MKFVLAILGFVIVLACSESNIDKVQFPKELIFVNLETSEPKLYTNKKEIKNKTTIEDLKKRFLWGGFENLDTSFFKNTFLSKDSASLFLDPTQKYSYQKSGKLFKFFSNEKGFVRNNAVWLDMIKYKLTLIPINNSVISNTQTMYIARGNFEDLTMNFINFVYRPTDPLLGNINLFGTVVFRGMVCNEFDSSFINKIPKSDTLIIQEYKLRFKAK